MAKKSRKNVGLIGLGIIGSRIAAGLRAAGYHVFVWNRTPRPAPNFLGSPAEVAEICDFIQIFVSDGNAVREVVESMASELTERHVVINSATIGPEATQEIAQIVQLTGAGFLDAPFTGSKLAADKAQLVYYVGGEEEVFAKSRPVLEATSRAIVRCGKLGEAATLKVATNLITAVTTQTLAEALAIVRSAGIAPEAFVAAIEHNACKSGITEMKLPKMISGDYEPHFSVKHMFKDVQLGIHIANRHKVEVPLTSVAGGVLYGAMRSGCGDLDFASLFKVYGDQFTAQKAAALTDRRETPTSSPTTEKAAEEPKKEETKPNEPVVIEAQIVDEELRELEVLAEVSAASSAKIESAEPVIAEVKAEISGEEKKSDAAVEPRETVSIESEADSKSGGLFARLFRRRTTADK